MNRSFAAVAEDFADSTIVGVFHGGVAGFQRLVPVETGTPDVACVLKRHGELDALLPREMGEPMAEPEMADKSARGRAIIARGERL